MTVHASLSADGNKIVLSAGYADRERIKRVPGARWKAQESVWQVPATLSSCVILQAEFTEDLVADDSVTGMARDAVRQRAAARALADNPLGTDHAPAHDYDDRLYPYQRLGADWLRLVGSGLLADEMGSGKTVQVAVSLPDDGPVLVVAPKSVLPTWQRELRTWAPHLRVVVATGGVAKQRKAFRAVADGDADVLVINYEALKSHSRLAPYGSIRLKRCDACGGVPGEVTEARCEVHKKEANEIGWVAVVVDEAHRMKDAKAQQTRAVWAVGQQPTVRHRWALTGTPIANNAGDLWSVLHFIDPAQWPSRTAYLDRWLDIAPNPWGGIHILGLRPDRADEFHFLVDPYMLRRTKDMTLPHLPPKIRTARECYLSPRERKAYDEMRDDLIATLEDGTDLAAMNPMVQVGRLLQLASSSLKADSVSGKPVPCDPSAKLDLLDEVLGDLGDEPLVVWFAHRQLLHLAEDRLRERGAQFVSYHGNMTSAERGLAEERFQQGRVPLMLLTIGAGKEGLTLTRASTQVYVQRTWSLVDDLQSQDRLHRPGQDADHVLIIDLIAENTVEAQLHDKLATKALSLEEVVQDRAALLSLLRDQP